MIPLKEERHIHLSVSYAWEHINQRHQKLTVYPGNSCLGQWMDSALNTSLMPMETADLSFSGPHCWRLQLILVRNKLKQGLGIHPSEPDRVFLLDGVRSCCKAKTRLLSCAVIAIKIPTDSFPDANTSPQPLHTQEQGAQPVPSDGCRVPSHGPAAQMVTYNRFKARA